tara:strand:+ start:179 stop:370 length:192 start_codon:yes stop_codon:yes gene_type:complete
MVHTLHENESEINEDHKEEKRELKADILADNFANKLFLNDDVTVRQANHVYVHVKKVLMKTLK